MSRVVIRPCKDDEGEWRRLGPPISPSNETVLPEDVFASTFARLTGAAAEGEYRGLLATLDGRPVGLAHYLFHRSCWTVDNICYLQDLFADPDVRGSAHRPRADRRRLCQGEGGGRAGSLLDDAGFQRHRPPALRPHRRQDALHRLSEEFLRHARKV